MLCSLFRLQTGRVPTGPYQANHSDHDRTTQPPPLGRSASTGNCFRTELNLGESLSDRPGSRPGDRVLPNESAPLPTDKTRKFPNGFHS